MRNDWRIILLACTMGAALALSACGTKNGNTAGQPAAQTPAAQTPTAQTPAAQPAAPSTPPPASTPAPATTAINAESIVKANCIACHGDTLDGKGNEKRNLTKVGGRLTKEQIASTITNGRGGMPTFKDKLKDTEIAAVAEWLAAKK